MVGPKKCERDESGTTEQTNSAETSSQQNEEQMAQEFFLKYFRRGLRPYKNDKEFDAEMDELIRLGKAHWDIFVQVLTDEFPSWRNKIRLIMWKKFFDEMPSKD